MNFDSILEKYRTTSLTDAEKYCAMPNNSDIVVSNIPAKAYEYVVNGKSAIEWIMERYQVKTDPKSGITNDPNHWSEEVGNERYILDLLLSLVNVSVQTVDIVNNLPKFQFQMDS